MKLSSMEEKPSRQIIYVDVDEEVTSLFDRLKNLRKKEILLVIPRKAVLFQSGVNLKILKSKMEAKGKKLVVVTSDRNGIHLAERVGLEVMSKIEVEESQAPIEENPQVLIRPIQAMRNEVPREETPQRTTERKMSIRELIQEFRMRDHRKKKSDEPVYASALGRPSRKVLTLILLISIGLFGLIGYIAFPSATVYIRPKFDNLDFTVNITLADKRRNQVLLQQNKPNVVASESVQTTTKQTKVFSATSMEFKGKNAKGKLRILNTENEDWTLKAGTRFMTPDGVFFRIAKGVVVPLRTIGESGEPIPGSLTVNVEADPFDLYGKPVGDRGNVGLGKFTIPALSKYNQRLIWGESDAPMVGGVTQYEPIVRKEDIEAAKKEIQSNLILMAKEDLHSYIDEINQLNQTHMVLMDDERYLKTTLVDLRYADGLEGSHRDKFELFAKIDAQGVAFDFDQLFAILKKEIGGRTHPDMRLRESSLAPDNVTYEVIEESPDLGQIKVTASIKGIEEYAIEPTTEAGLRFDSRLKEKIVGLSVSDAENLVGNLPEVDAVKIKTWPVWIHSVPQIPEGIDVKLMEDSN
jgi:hypothetical protein